MLFSDSSKVILPNRDQMEGVKHRGRGHERNLRTRAGRCDGAKDDWVLGKGSERCAYEMIRLVVLNHDKELVLVVHKRHWDIVLYDVQGDVTNPHVVRRSRLKIPRQ